MVSIPFAAALLAMSGVGETVLLDFSAPWCGPCQMMEPKVDQLSAMGYPVRKINIDQNKALAQRFGVSSIPCFVLVVDGQERDRLVGGTSVQQLVQMMQRAGVQRPGEAVALTRGQSPDRGLRGLFSRGRSRTPSPPAIPKPPTVSLGQEAPQVASPPSGLAPSTTMPSAPAAPDQLARVTPQPAPNLVPVGRMADAPRPAPIGPPTPNGSLDDRSMDARLLKATVRLKIRDADGFSLGTGTIIDFRPDAEGSGGKALVLTCGHVFRDSQGRGPIEVDLFDGSGARGLPATMVRFDLPRDIGLIVFQTDRPVTSIPLAPVSHKVPKGTRVISVGCDHGNAPTVHRSHVTAINSFVGPPNLQVAGQPAEGRSGGGLFDTQGQLIGVCNFADPTDRAGLYAAVEIAHSVMRQAGLPVDQIAQRGRSGPRATTTPQVLSSVGLTRGRSTDLPVEIICIVRTGAGANRQSETVLIDRASPELMKLLLSEQQRNKDRVATSATP